MFFKCSHLLWKSNIFILHCIILSFIVLLLTKFNLPLLRVLLMALILVSSFFFFGSLSLVRIISFLKSHASIHLAPINVLLTIFFTWGIFKTLPRFSALSNLIHSLFLLRIPKIFAKILFRSCKLLAFHSFLPRPECKKPSHS